MNSGLVTLSSNINKLGDYSIVIEGRLDSTSTGSIWQEAMNALEKYMITNVLVRQAHHRLNTAKTLGITRRALQYKLKKYDLLDD